ncbi:MAG: hypothetical protein ACJ73D_08460 [Pyrinomonadaceae bacterium]
MRLAAWTTIITVTLLIGGCSSNTPDVGNASAGSRSGSSNSVAAGNAVVANAGVNGGTMTAANRFDPIKNRRVTSPGVAPPSNAPLEFRPGAENSETATTMNEQGQPLEVRVFKDNPQITKVEAVWLDAKKKLLRITLRNGSTVEVTTDQIADLASAPSRQLVELVGGPK